MLIQNSNIKIILSLLLILLLVIVGVKMLSSKEEQVEEPLRSLRVIVGVDNREKFFDQLRKFSEKNSFAIRIAPTKPDESSFISQMWREDFKLIAVNPFEEDEYRVYFYKNNKFSVDEKVLNFLVVEFSSLINEIEGVRITNQ